MKNYFKGTGESPFHISIGAVLRNKEGDICCHYFKRFSHKSIGTFDDFYLLMRETIEPNETIEVCLERGLMEEFGATGNINCFLGSIVSDIPIVGSNVVIEKTTLYFLSDFVSIDEKKRKKDDPESVSEIQWLKPMVLIDKMKEQGIRFKRRDVDESVIIERLLT